MMGSSSKKTKTTGAKVDTVIGHQTEIHGDVRFTGGLHVDGTIRGNVYANSDTDAVAIISERGRVEGELRVPSLLINGHIEGDVYASERLDLAKEARIKGDVYYSTLEMAGGAEINGKLVRTDEDSPRFLEHQAAAEPGASESESRERKEPEEPKEPTGFDIDELANLDQNTRE